MQNDQYKVKNEHLSFEILSFSFCILHFAVFSSAHWS